MCGLVARALACGLDACDDPFDLPGPVFEPIGRPDVHQRPPTCLEDLMTKPIAIAGCLRRVIRDAVALDAADEAAGRVRVLS